MNKFLKRIIDAYQDQPVAWKIIPLSTNKETKKSDPITYREEINDLVRQKKTLLILGPHQSKNHFPYMDSLLEGFKENPKKCVLFVFPTNSLLRSRLKDFQDQFPEIAYLTDAYDGNTPLKRRTFIRNECRFIFTNPDMIHCSTLSNHRHWKYLLSHLDFIVLDEVHNYSNVFGGHVANVLRRLTRLGGLYGSSPLLIGTSNVFKNPVEFFRSLTGLVPHVVEIEKIDSSDKIYLALGTFEPDIFLSTTHLTTSLLTTFLLTDKTCMVLASSQALAEQILNPTRNLLIFNNVNPQKIKSYFSNESPEEINNINILFSQQKIKSIITYTLSKGGVDHSKVNILIIHGYPGQNYKFWQEVDTFIQDKKEAYIFLILRKDPLQQHVFQYPDLLNQLNPIYCSQENLSILQDHLLLAASETPLQYQEVEQFGPHALDVIEELEGQGKIVRQHFHFKPKTLLKAIHVNLRVASKQNISLIQNEEVTKKVDLSYALKELYPGAIYLSAQKAFQVHSLDIETKEAHATEVIPTYLTQPIRKHQLLIKKILETKKKCYYCQIQLNTQTVAYQKVHVESYQPLSLHSLELPPYIMITESVHLKCEDSTRTALHGLEHVLWIISPLITGASRQEIGFYHSMNSQDEVIFFDFQPGGSGISKLLYQNMSLALHEAKEFLENCSCYEGCSQCLWHNYCPTQNRDLSRPLTLQLINTLLKDF